MAFANFMEVLMEKEEIYERVRYIKEENSALFKKEEVNLIAADNVAELLLISPPPYIY